MEFTIKDDETGNELLLQAEPEDYNGQQGWRVVFPGKDSFVMVEKNGYWQACDEPGLNPDFVQAIGASLTPIARYNSSGKP